MDRGIGIIEQINRTFEELWRRKEPKKGAKESSKQENGECSACEVAREEYVKHPGYWSLLNEGRATSRKRMGNQECREEDLSQNGAGSVQAAAHGGESEQTLLDTNVRGRETRGVEKKIQDSHAQGRDFLEGEKKTLRSGSQGLDILEGDTQKSGSLGRDFLEERRAQHIDTLSSSFNETLLRIKGSERQKPGLRPSSSGGDIRMGATATRSSELLSQLIARSTPSRELPRTSSCVSEATKTEREVNTNGTTRSGGRGRSLHVAPKTDIGNTQKTEKDLELAMRQLDSMVNSLDSGNKQDKCLVMDSRTDRVSYKPPIDRAADRVSHKPPIDRKCVGIGVAIDSMTPAVGTTAYTDTKIPAGILKSNETHQQQSAGPMTNSFTTDAGQCSSQCEDRASGNQGSCGSVGGAWKNAVSDGCEDTLQATSYQQSGTTEGKSRSGSLLGNNIGNLHTFKSQEITGTVALGGGNNVDTGKMVSACRESSSSLVETVLVKSCIQNHFSGVVDTDTKSSRSVGVCKTQNGITAFPICSDVNPNQAHELGRQTNVIESRIGEVIDKCCLDKSVKPVSVSDVKSEPKIDKSNLDESVKPVSVSDVESEPKSDKSGGNDSVKPVSVKGVKPELNSSVPYITNEPSTAKLNGSAVLDEDSIGKSIRTEVPSLHQEIRSAVAVQNNENTISLKVGSDSRSSIEVVQKIPIILALHIDGKGSPPRREKVELIHHQVTPGGQDEETQPNGNTNTEGTVHQEKKQNFDEANPAVGCDGTTEPATMSTNQDLEKKKAAISLVGRKKTNSLTNEANYIPVKDKHITPRDADKTKKVTSQSKGSGKEQKKTNKEANAEGSSGTKKSLLEQQPVIQQQSSTREIMEAVATALETICEDDRRPATTGVSRPGSALSDYDNAGRGRRLSSGGKSPGDGSSRRGSKTLSPGDGSSRRGSKTLSPLTSGTMSPAERRDSRAFSPLAFSSIHDKIQALSRDNSQIDIPAKRLPKVRKLNDSVLTIGKEKQQTEKSKEIVKVAPKIESSLQSKILKFGKPSTGAKIPKKAEILKNDDTKNSVKSVTQEQLRGKFHSAIGGLTIADIEGPQPMSACNAEPQKQTTVRRNKPKAPQPPGSIGKPESVPSTPTATLKVKRAKGKAPPPPDTTDMGQTQEGVEMIHENGVAQIDKQLDVEKTQDHVLNSEQHKRSEPLLKTAQKTNVEKIQDEVSQLLKDTKKFHKETKALPSSPAAKRRSSSKPGTPVTTRKLNVKSELAADVEQTTKLVKGESLSAQQNTELVEPSQNSKTNEVSRERSLNPKEERKLPTKILESHSSAETIVIESQLDTDLRWGADQLESQRSCKTHIATPNLESTEGTCKQSSAVSTVPLNAGISNGKLAMVEEVSESKQSSAVSTVPLKVGISNGKPAMVEEVSESKPSSAVSTVPLKAGISNDKPAMVEEVSESKQSSAVSTVPLKAGISNGKPAMVEEVSESKQSSAVSTVPLKAGISNGKPAMVEDVSSAPSTMPLKNQIPQIQITAGSINAVPTSVVPVPTSVVPVPTSVVPVPTSVVPVPTSVPDGTLREATSPSKSQVMRNSNTRGPCSEELSAPNKKTKSPELPEVEKLPLSQNEVSSQMPTSAKRRLDLNQRSSQLMMDKSRVGLRSEEGDLLRRRNKQLLERKPVGGGPTGSKCVLLTDASALHAHADTTSRTQQDGDLSLSSSKDSFVTLISSRSPSPSSSYDSCPSPDIIKAATSLVKDEASENMEVVQCVERKVKYSSRGEVIEEDCIVKPLALFKPDVGEKKRSDYLTETYSMIESMRKQLQNLENLENSKKDEEELSLSDSLTIKHPSDDKWDRYERQIREYESRERSPYSPFSDFSDESYEHYVSSSRRSSRCTSTPRRVFPQVARPVQLDNGRDKEDSPVVIEAGLSFDVCSQRPSVRHQFRPQPAFSDPCTTSSALSTKIANFLNRTDHVMEEWKRIGRSGSSEMQSLVELPSHRKSRSATNIMIKGLLNYSRGNSAGSSLRSPSKSRYSESSDRTLSDLDELSELAVDLSEERATGTSSSDRLEAETAERIRLEHELSVLQHEKKNLQQQSERLELELFYARADVNGLSEGEGDAEDASGVAAMYKQKCERAMRELEFTRRRLQQQHEDDLEQLVGLKKQLEKKLSDAYEEVEEQRQVVGQWKRKVAKLQAEMSDLRLLMEEQNSRNNLLEKKQRKFDSEIQMLQDELRGEKSQRDRSSREREIAFAEKFSIEQNLSSVRLELELKEEKVAALSRELEELTKGGGTEQEVTSLRKAKHDLEMKLKEQEEELDEMAGQVSMLEGTKLRLEMSLESVRKDHRREMSQRDDELDEVRSNTQKKVKGLEAQLEASHEERTLLLREKHELERRLTDAEDRGRHFRAADEDALLRLRRDLTKTKALLRDAQVMLERAKQDSPSKATLRALKNQLDDAELARASAAKAKQTLESELSEVTAQLEEVSRAKDDAESKNHLCVRESNALKTQLEDNEEELQELLKKYRQTVQQLSAVQMKHEEAAGALAESEVERSSLRDQLAEATAKLEATAATVDPTSGLTQKRLEIRVKELESRLELEQTTRSRLEVQISRLKENVERLGEECAQSRNKEQAMSDGNRKLQRSLRESKEELNQLQAKDQEAVHKRRELEKRLDAAEQEAMSARTDLRLAVKRIEDLQTAISGEIQSDSDRTESEGDTDSGDESLMSQLASSRSLSRASRSSETPR